MPKEPLAQPAVAKENQDEGTLCAFAVERDAEMVIAPLVNFVGTAFPDANVASAVLTFGDGALEVAEAEVTVESAVPPRRSSVAVRPAIV